MYTLRAWVAATTLASVIAACGDSEGGAGGGGGAAATSSATGTSSSASPANSGSTDPVGSGGAGGAPDLDKDPAEVTDAADCYYEGGNEGGARGWACNAAQIELSDPLPREGLTIRIEASDGTIFEDLGDDVEDWRDQPGFYADDPVTVLVLRYSPQSDPTHYDPEWLDVEVRRDGALVGSERFEPLDYACTPRNQDEWCWEAAPVTLEITNPE